MRVFNLSHLRLITCPFYPLTRIQQVIAYGKVGSDPPRPVLASGSRIVSLQVQFPETREKLPWPYETMFDLREFLVEHIGANLRAYYEQLDGVGVRAQRCADESERIRSHLSAKAKRHDLRVNIAGELADIEDEEKLAAIDLVDEASLVGLGVAPEKDKGVPGQKAYTVAVTACMENYPGVLYLLLSGLLELPDGRRPSILNIEYFRTLASRRKHIQDVEILGRYVKEHTASVSQINGLTFYGVGGACTTEIREWMDKVEDALGMVRVSTGRNSPEGLAVKYLRVLKKRYSEAESQRGAYPTVANCPVSRFENREMGQFGCPRIQERHGLSISGWPVKVKAKITDAPGSLRTLLEVVGVMRSAPEVPDGLEELSQPQAWTKKCV